MVQTSQTTVAGTLSIRVDGLRTPGGYPGRAGTERLTSNCQWAACSSCFAWSAAHPAVKTNWLIMTWCLSSSMFTELPAAPPDHRQSSKDPVKPASARCSLPFRHRSVSAASQRQQQQYFHLFTNNKELRASDWWIADTKNALIG